MGLSADGGSRTHTPKALDPKSSASANFATSARFVRNKGEQEEYHSTEAADNTRPTIC